MKSGNSIGMLLAVTVAMAGPVSGAPMDITTAAGKCQACHNRNAAMPRLEGQSASYLATRIRSFAYLTNQNPHAYFMFDVNANLSDETVVALAKYLSAKPMVEPARSDALAEKGGRLYRSGDGAGITACQSCHGARGEGGGTVPRLAGQRAAYLREQLEDFSMITRVHDTMNAQARNMTDDQINALVAYLSRD